MSEDQTYFVSDPEPDDDKFLHITEVSRFDDFAYLRFHDFTMPDGTKIIINSTPETHMSDKPKVFCKDCKWIDKTAFCTTKPNSKFECLHAKSNLGYEPINGIIKRDTCYNRNANCDCPDYEAKDGESK